MTVYYRPLVQTGTLRPASAQTIAGGWCWFDHAERLQRGQRPELIQASEIPDEALHAITSPRPPICGLFMDQPRLMGILNLTPDSFSDGGQFQSAKQAASRGYDMSQTGADIIDVGGESTRPGAKFVPSDAEIERTQSVIRAIRELSQLPISADTRKATVAKAALDAGVNIINDVSALSYDQELADIVAKSGAGLCLMHAQGSPATMQKDPTYDDVLLDVYDHLAQRVAFAESKGISRDKIIVDPGIGFGKTIQHNLSLIKGISLLHGLGCPILLGVSRKRFIGELAGTTDAKARLPGSIAIALSAITQGVQINRVHDIAETRQALTLWLATTKNGQMP